MEWEEAEVILRDMLPGPIVPPVHAGSQKQEAIRVALAALRGPTREMVERMRGEWQSIHGLSEYYCSRCGEEFEIHSYDKDKYQFCPHCLAPMTDEAADMMMGRWRQAMEMMSLPAPPEKLEQE